MNDRLKRDADSAEKDFGIKKIFEKLGIITQLKGWDIGTAGGTQPETVDDDKADGDNQQKKDCSH